MRKQANLEIQFRESERGLKGEGGEEASNPESEHLPAKAHRTSFARKRTTLIAKMKGESPDARIPCGHVWLSPERRVHMKIHDSCQTQLKRVLFLAASVLLNLTPNATHASVVGFEELSLAQNSYWNGSSGVGSFTSGGVTFPNSYDSYWGSWNGFAYSNVQDSTTLGWGNQYAARPGTGYSGSANYAVGYQPLGGNIEISLGGISNFSGRGLHVANTTYAALDMQNGSGFSKKFGGTNGAAADWFRLTVRGLLGGLETGAVDFYLADFRFANSADDYILSSWAFIDLTALGNVDQLRFALTSSDTGDYGMNTPAYFALDNLRGVPEPSCTSLLMVSGLCLAVSRRAKRALRP